MHDKIILLLWAASLGCLAASGNVSMSRKGPLKVCNEFPGFKSCFKNAKKLCSFIEGRKNRKACLRNGETICTNRYCAACDKGSLKELPLSMINCTASSEFSSEFLCKFAISDPIVYDADRPAWATKNQNYGGGSIKLYFDVPIAIKNVQLLQRYVPQNNVRQVVFKFDGGNIEYANLDYFGTYNWNKISINKANNNVLTKTLSISIAQVPPTALPSDIDNYLNPGFKAIRIIGCF